MTALEIASAAPAIAPVIAMMCFIDNLPGLARTDPFRGGQQDSAYPNSARRAHRFDVS
jgi:hypothetical protein